MNTQKKKANRRLKSVGEDCISELPDEIIIHILSFLPSTKLCVKTSVLSKRWHHLWTYVPNIILTEYDFPYDECEHHIMERVVNKALALHSSSKINYFSIQIPDSQDLYESIESWLQLAAGRAVESLTLNINGSSARYLFPEFLYSNSNIQSLTTKLWEFVPDARISWSALKELSIRQATLNDEVIQNILCGTPVLEDLQLHFCHGIKLLDLSLKPKLKNLVINVKESYFGDRDYDFKLKIVGPYVEILKLHWSRDNLRCKLMNMSSLVKATLDIEVIDDEDGEDDYQEWCPDMVKELVENVLPSEQLQLTNFCTLALSTLRMDVMASLSSNLKSLNVDCRGEEYLCGIERILQCSPKLEKLVIFFDYGRSSKSKSDGYRKGYWTNAEKPSCLGSHLKTIEVSDLIRTRVVVEFLQFLLMNSNILEKMIFRHSDHKSGLKLAEKWSSFPRSSQQAVFPVATKCFWIWLSNVVETDARPSMADVVRELKTIWHMMLESHAKTTNPMSTNPEKTVSSSSSSMVEKHPNVSTDVSGSNLVSGVIPTITPREPTVFLFPKRREICKACWRQICKSCHCKPFLSAYYRQKKVSSWCLRTLTRKEARVLEMNSNKKKANRRLKSVGEDRISELPDAIIIHILSLLPSTKLCAKTCVLSKRWQHLWTYVPNITLSQYDFPYNERKNIIKRVVNETLAFHSSSKLNNFSIKISDLQELYPSIESWLQLAVGRAVESLTLEFSGSSTCYLLPQFLYSNSNIRSLTTKFCKFVPDERISWSALKELSIRQSTLTDEDIQNILYGTPLLEDLQLNYCHGIKLLDLSLKPKLKNLVINVKEFYFEGCEFELKIVGPYVETLKLYWTRDNLRCKLMNMSSLVKATLDIEFTDDEDDEDGEDYYQEWFPNMLKELVENVLSAEQLQLANFCTLALSTLRMDVMASLSSNLKSLNVDCHGEEYLCGIERVLQCSPKLEKLDIFFDYGRSSKSKSNGYRKGYWTNAEIPSCLDSHLKTIEVSGLIRTRVVVEFLQFLLKNSRVLDKMIFRHYNNNYGLKLAEKWSSFPRSSQQAAFLAPK